MTKPNELAMKIAEQIDDCWWVEDLNRGNVPVTEIAEKISSSLTQHFPLNCPVCFNVAEITVNAQPDGIHHRTNYIECKTCGHFQDLDVLPATGSGRRGA